MSEYHVQKTLFKDPDELVKALQAVKVGCADIEVERHEVAQPLFDFRGSRTHYLNESGDVANIIVRRKYVAGMSNDLGFIREADGTYSAIVSEYDSRQGCNVAWLKQLKRDYVERVDMKTAAKKGLKFLGRKVVNGKVQLRYMQA